MGRTKVMTAEAATSGHPDKLCDLIADSILDAILREDRFARVSCEVVVTTGMVVVTGQITTKCYVEISSIVRDTIRRVGYEDPSLGFDYQSCAVVVMLEEQSSGVSLGVDRKGAGDQGIVIGYATDEGAALPGGTELMPVPAFLANRLAERLEAVRLAGRIPCLRPDGKTQVSVAYEDGRPVGLTHVVVSAHHCAEVELAKIRADIQRLVVRPVLKPTGLLSSSTKVLINPLGPFLEGGPKGDAGMVGRKITVDCYGSACPHGGSAFSGKDPTKPDRSGSYGARWAAKNIVAAGLARECVVEAAYVIGLPHPIAVRVETHGTGRLPDAALEDLVSERFDLSPAAIIENLDLRRPIYAATARYGHFGRLLPDFTWERTDGAAELSALAGGKGGRGRRTVGSAPRRRPRAGTGKE